MTNKSESINNLMKVLGNFQNSVKAIPKTADNPFFKSKFAPLNKIVEYIQPILEKNGLVVSQDITSDNGVDTLTTLLFHTPSGEWKESVALLHLAKSDPQAQASAVTYLRRYTLVTTLGLQVDKDDDGQKGTEEKDKEVEKQNNDARNLDVLRDKLSKAFTTNADRSLFVQRVTGKDCKISELDSLDVVAVIIGLDE
jgi:hypothetical protein